MRDFSGKVALVTGAGNGFGKAFAIEAARRGMKVALVDIDPIDVEGVKYVLIQQGATDVESIVADLSTPENVKEAVQKVIQRFGQIDLLFNNAGVSPMGDIVHIPARDLDWGLSVNLNGHAYMMMEVLRIMMAQGTPAHIMNTASLAGVVGGLGGNPTYSASKHADVALCEDARNYLRAHQIENIGISVFCPGFVQTDLHHNERHRPPRFRDDSDPFYQSEMFLKLSIYNSILNQTGMPIDGFGLRLFQAIEQEQMYVLTHPEAIDRIQARHRKIEKAFAAKLPTESTQDYTGQVALITGAAHGFGKSFAEEAAAKGMKLALVDIDKPALEKVVQALKQEGAEVIGIPTDVSRYEEIVFSVKETKKQLGRIDVLFNNAGVACPEDIAHIRPQDWEWVIRVNLMGQMFYLKEVLPIMMEQKTKAHIISTASIAGFLPGFGKNPSYSSSKNGMVAVTESVQEFLASNGLDFIKVSVFCPGFVQTNLHHSDDYRPERFSKDKDPEHYESKDYEEALQRLTQNITTGLPNEGFAKRLFASMETDETYLITHPNYLEAVQARFAAMEKDAIYELKRTDVMSRVRGN